MKLKPLEQFKDIQGYNGRYQITSWSRVFNVDKQRFIKPYIHDNGYLRVDLYEANGKKKHHKVHRLVAKAFIPNPDHKPQVNHIDGNNQNNSITNLEWSTNKENQDHAKKLRNGTLRDHKTGRITICTT